MTSMTKLIKSRKTTTQQQLQLHV